MSDSKGEAKRVTTDDKKADSLADARIWTPFADGSKLDASTGFTFSERAWSISHERYIKVFVNTIQNDPSIYRIKDASSIADVWIRLIIQMCVDWKELISPTTTKCMDATLSTDISCAIPLYNAIHNTIQQSSTFSMVIAKWIRTLLIRLHDNVPTLTDEILTLDVHGHHSSRKFSGMVVMFGALRMIADCTPKRWSDGMSYASRWLLRYQLSMCRLK